MANLTETPKWEDIYQLETSDRALGGPGGIMNKQAQQLANRTALLKKTLEENTGAATINNAGIVKLSNSIDSDSETEAATSKAVQATYNLVTATNKTVELLTNKLKTTPFLSDFASFDIENGTYHALGADSAIPSLNCPPDSYNAVLTVTVRNRGDVVHFEASETNAYAPRKWVGEYYNQSEGVIWTKVITASDYQCSLATNGWQKLPSGLVIQWGQALPSNGLSDVKFPIAFANRPFNVTFGYRESTYPTYAQSIAIEDKSLTNTGFRCRTMNATTPVVNSASAFFWRAEGV